MEYTIHILPENDLRPHKDVGVDCPCKPDVEIELGGTTVIHNAWDGREFFEISELKKGH